MPATVPNPECTFSPQIILEAHLLQQTTLSIPVAGALLGLDRAAAYRAAKRGFLPTVQVSERRWVVPTARLLELLGLSEQVRDAGEAKPVNES
jgi:hypothetical protein